jgi:hypothetical protein
MGRYRWRRSSKRSAGASEIKQPPIWAQFTNERLRERGLQARIDHRTLEAQGIERTPTLHKGPLLAALEQVARRLDQERAQDVQARLERAAELGRLEREQAATRESILVSVDGHRRS